MPCYNSKANKINVFWNFSNQSVQFLIAIFFHFLSPMKYLFKKSIFLGYLGNFKSLFIKFVKMSGKRNKVLNLFMHTRRTEYEIFRKLFCNFLTNLIRKFEKKTFLKIVSRKSSTTTLIHSFLSYQKEWNGSAWKNTKLR